LVTYADALFKRNAEALCASALRSGFDQALVFTPDDLKGSTFADHNAGILSQPRGSGYWIWKPYIIRCALERVQPVDCVLYCDAGRTSYYRFTHRPRRLEQLVWNNPQGFLLGPEVPHHGPLSRWCKRDCFVLMDADTPEIRQHPTAVLTWSLWRPTTAAFQFLAEWQRYCEDPRCSTDLPNALGLPNYPDFVDHRHDLAIATVLAVKLGAPFIRVSHTFVQRLLALRPDSYLAHQFYKRPENVDDLLGAVSPSLLVREYFRLRAVESPVAPPRAPPGVAHGT
jgi:hypothetical protein